MDEFKCTECKQIFYKKRYLNTHIRRKHKHHSEEENNKIYKCIHCEKGFKSLDSLSKHRRRTHAQYNLKMNIVCQEDNCNERFFKLSNFRNHLKLHHGFENNDYCQEKSFKSKEEFESWLAEEQKECKSSFVMARGEQKCSTHTTKSYICSRSGHYISLSKGKRQLKAQGSKRIGHHCTSQILMKQYENRIDIQYFPSHYKHDSLLSHIPLSQDIKNTVAGKLLQGVSDSRIIRDIQGCSTFDDGQTSSSHNSFNDILSSKSRNSNFVKKEYEISCSVEKTGLSTDECCEKHDQVPDIINGINININNLNASKTDTGLIILEKDSNALKHLEVPTNKSQQSNCTSTDSQLKSSGGTSSFVSGQWSNQDSLVSNPGGSDGCSTNFHIKQKLFTSVKNSSALNSDSTVKENTISLSESSKNDDDVEILVINEIKKEKFVSIIQPSQSNNCRNDLITNKCPSRSNPVINVENNNNATVNQATVCSVQPTITEVCSVQPKITEVCSVQPTITEVCSSKQKENFSQSNPVKNVELNNLQDEIKQAVVYNVPNEVNQNYNSEHVNSSNIKTNYNTSTSSLLNEPTTINQMQITSTKYILPDYSSSGSFANNTQYYIVLNTPMNSSVSGAYMTVPGIETNVSNPVLPSVNTTFVKYSASQVVSGVSNPLPIITLAANRTVPAPENNLVSAHENIPTKSNVSGPQTTTVTQSTARLPKILLRGKKRISYRQFLESDMDESDTDEFDADEFDMDESDMDVSDMDESVCSVGKKRKRIAKKTKCKTGKKHDKKEGMTANDVLPNKNCKTKEKQGTSRIELCRNP